MDVDQRLPCTHGLRCINCHDADRKDDIGHASDSRRCPIRLDKYGTARQRERQQRPTADTTNANGSAKRAQRKKNTVAPKPAAPAAAPVTSQNRFAPLEEPSVDNILQKAAQSGVVITREQAEIALKTVMQETPNAEWQAHKDKGW